MKYLNKTEYRFSFFGKFEEIQTIKYLLRENNWTENLFADSSLEIQSENILSKRK